MKATFNGQGRTDVSARSETDTQVGPYTRPIIDHSKWIVVFLIIAFVLGVGGTVSEAQQPAKVPRIGFLIASATSVNTARNEAFRQGLRELGYVEGKNIFIEWRSAEGKADRLAGLAAELVASQGRHHRLGWSFNNPRRQASDFYDSHCHGAGS